MYIYIYKYIYIHTYIHIYIHTYISQYALFLPVLIEKWLAGHHRQNNYTSLFAVKLRTVLMQHGLMYTFVYEEQVHVTKTLTAHLVSILHEVLDDLVDVGPGNNSDR